MATQQKRPFVKSKGLKANLSNWKMNQPEKHQHVGKKPLPEPTSIKQMCLILTMHVCRRIVFFDPKLKVALYMGTLSFLSLVTDFLPFPRSYFSNKDNMFNQYFVKLAWGWTLLLLGSFIVLSSYIYCCGHQNFVKKHASRLLVGTVVWYCFTNLFLIIESSTGTCYTTSAIYTTRSACLKSGFRWHGFDISGHSFLLVYCALLIMEECKAIRGWERIGELLRYQEFEEDSPLKGLTENEKTHLKDSYEQYTPYVKGLFIVLTTLLLLWDVMLVATALYFHSMVQKVLGGGIAIVLWFVTYRIWYETPFSPGLPGEGPFKYANVQPLSGPSNSRSSVSRSSVSRN